MRYGAVIILFISFFFVVFCSYAQPESRYIFRHIDQADGLLHNRIFSITQDERGFIWILTPNGLQRYDGSLFVNYPYDLNNAAGATYTSGTNLFADKKNNRLWIIDTKIQALDLKKNNLVAYDPKQLLNDPQFSFETYRDSVNNPWLAGNFGVFRFDNSTKEMKPYYLTASYLNRGMSNCFFVDDINNESWLTGWSTGLLLFDKKTKQIYSHSYNPLHHPLLQLMDKAGLFYVYIDSDRNIWITSGRTEFYKYDPSNQKLTVYSLSDIKQKLEKSKNPDATAMVHCFFEDNHHTLWLGTQNAGLLKYNKEKDSFLSIKGQKEEQQYIRYNYDINCIFQDAEENIWLGTDKGITIFNPYRQYFQSVYHDEHDPLTLPKNEIQECIETSNGDILVGTWGGGIAVYDNQWHFKKNIHFPRSPVEYNMLWSFIQNDDGTIWAGCQHGYIHIYDPVKETIYTIHPPELNNYTIRCMAKDKNGNILLGLHNGKIAMWDKTQNKFYGYNEGAKGIRQTFVPVLSLFIDNKQQCWVGSEDGFKQFDKDKMVYTAVYQADKNDPHAISANTIQSIDQLDDSTLAIGTIYGGLNFFNTNTKIFSHLTTGNNLPFNNINNVKKDKTNQIWFTTDYGLYKYIPGGNKFIHYNIEPGIINSSFKSGNFYCLENGRWLAATTTEIISFNPDSLQKQENNNGQVYITGFKVFDKNIFIDSLLYSKAPVELSYKQNFLSIEYGALNFSGLQETKYYYQLKGIDKDWVHAGTKRFTSYTNLQPGEYIFNVRTENEGIDQKITSFKIIITPPFWKTAWFRILIFVLAVAVIYFLFRKRVAVIRREAEMKQKMAESEMMALRSQMNPHFIFNSLNSINNYILENDIDNASEYLATFSRLMRMMLDHSQYAFTPMEEEIKMLEMYLQLESLRFGNKFKYQISIDSSVNLLDTQIPTMLLQPYVENAIWHGLMHKHGTGCLNIAINKLNNHIAVTIEDDGIGRKKSAEINKGKRHNHKSRGLSLIEQRLQLLSKERKLDVSVQITDLVNEKEEAAGTKVLINIPVNGKTKM